MCFVPIQKQDLTVAEAKAVINGADAVDGEAGNGTDMIQLQIQQLSLELEQAKKVTLQKEEEVKLYKTKFDETTSQMTQLVSTSFIIHSVRGSIINSLMSSLSKKTCSAICSAIYCDVPGSPCLSKTGPVYGPFFFSFG